MDAFKISVAVLLIISSVAFFILLKLKGKKIKIAKWILLIIHIGSATYLCVFSPDKNWYELLWVEIGVIVIGLIIQHIAVTLCTPMLDHKSDDRFNTSKG